jgi:hypothetical protein
MMAGGGVRRREALMAAMFEFTAADSLAFSRPAHLAPVTALQDSAARNRLVRERSIALFDQLRASGAESGRLCYGDRIVEAVLIERSYVTERGRTDRSPTTSQLTAFYIDAKGHVYRSHGRRDWRGRIRATDRAVPDVQTTVVVDALQRCGLADGID